jgi:cobalt-zinc-cadmium efflux system membrane fusion protein
LITLTADQAGAIGLETSEVRSQDRPTRLAINGTTAYDPNTQVQVRPRFTSLIDRVYVTLGQQVKAGDPLVDLFSSDLAAAKSDYEKAQARWQHDKGELDRAEKLFHETPRAMSEKEYLAIANDEKVSRAEAKVAADKLLVYGISPEELKRVPDETGTDKAKLTLYAPSGGVVIRKDVVRGNLYDETDVLMVIAPLDHFWLWGNVYPSDAAEVSIGQRWVVRCPTRDEDTPCLVESLTSEVAEDTKTVRIRSRIDNHNGQLKANMLVTGFLEIPASPGCTVVPRLAMVSVDGADYAFVEKPGSDGTLRFERRKVRVAQEAHDEVVLKEGLTPGERVATRGSLLLAQMYEDAAIIEPGAPD